MRSLKFVKSFSLLLNGECTGVQDTWFHSHRQEFHLYAISNMNVLIVLKNLLVNCLENEIDLFVPVGRHVKFFIHAKTAPFSLWTLGLFCPGDLQNIPDMPQEQKSILNCQGKQTNKTVWFCFLLSKKCKFHQVYIKLN